MYKLTWFNFAMKSSFQAFDKVHCKSICVLYHLSIHCRMSTHVQTVVAGSVLTDLIPETVRESGR